MKIILKMLSAAFLISAGCATGPSPDELARRAKEAELSRKQAEQSRQQMEAERVRRKAEADAQRLREQARQAAAAEGAKPIITALGEINGIVSNKVSFAPLLSGGREKRFSIMRNTRFTYDHINGLLSVSADGFGGVYVQSISAKNIKESEVKVSIEKNPFSGSTGLMVDSRGIVNNPKMPEDVRVATVIIRSDMLDAVESSRHSIKFKDIIVEIYDINESESLRISDAIRTAVALSRTIRQ